MVIAVKPVSLTLVMVACVMGLACRTNESPEAQVNDIKITAQIRSKLVENIGPSSVTNISINSTNGVVTLSGQVDSQSIRQQAIATAQGVPNVVRVVDSLQVVTKPQSNLIREPGESSLQARHPRQSRSVFMIG